MHEFRVWAPLSGRVEVVLGDRRLPMPRAASGSAARGSMAGDWWACSVDEAGPGTDYAFSLDGGPPRPDPRSAFQPRGIHGPSRVVDHSAFRWSDSDWRGVALPGCVLYECHIGTFSADGTFDGAIEHLGHLVDLGVDAIELLPVAEFSGARGWGYDGVDLFAPHHGYGGPDGLKRLVDAAHGHGLGVVMDVVYNHLGPAGNYLPEFGPYFSARHQTNWGDAVNFDGPGSDEVRRFVTDNALAAHVRRPLFLIAESDLNDPRFVCGRDAGGYGLTASWADEWHHALHAALTGDVSGYYDDFGPLPLLAKALRQAWVYDGIYSPPRQRVHGRPPSGLAGSQFVVATQNHDQIGNRAAGERSAALMSDGRLRVAAALLLTSPFVPMLFQGEEWGASTPFLYFTDHSDPGLGRTVSDGRRHEFSSFAWDPDSVPDPQLLATFERSRLDWAEPRKDSRADLLAWYRRLIALRREIPALADPRLDRTSTEYDQEAGWIVVRRGPVAVASNLGDSTWTFPVDPSAELLAASAPSVERTRQHLTLPPDTVAIVNEGFSHI